MTQSTSFSWVGDLEMANAKGLELSDYGKKMSPESQVENRV